MLITCDTQRFLIRWEDNRESENSTQPLLNSSSNYSNDSAGVVASDTFSPLLSSILTIKPKLDPNNTPDPIIPGTTSPAEGSALAGPDSKLSVQTNISYCTAPSSTTAATNGHSSVQAVHTLHRFTLIRPGTKRSTATPGRCLDGGWNPLELFFPNGLLGQKCDICAKRIGRKPVLECDDCGLRCVFHLLTVTVLLIVSWHGSAHVKCGEVAPRDCGMRILQSQGVQLGDSSMPVSKARQNNNAKRAPLSPVMR